MASVAYRAKVEERHQAKALIQSSSPGFWMEIRQPPKFVATNRPRNATMGFLITGNRKHFPAFWKNTKIVTPREFVSLFAPHLIHCS
jgi:hypothetical protein